MNTVILTGTVTEPVQPDRDPLRENIRFTVALPLSYEAVPQETTAVPSRIPSRRPRISTIDCIAQGTSARFAANLQVGQEVTFRVDAIRTLTNGRTVFIASKVTPGIKTERYAPHTTNTLPPIKCVGCAEYFPSLHDCEHHTCPGDLNPHISAPPCECLASKSNQSDNSQ